MAQVTLYEPSQVKPWRVVWLDLENRHVLQEQRQSTSPIQVVRWSHAGAHAWGEGLGSLVLADVKTLNLMVKLNLTAAQKAVDPPLLAHEELGVRAIKTQPGALIYGALDREGRRLLEPFTSGANVPLGLEMEEQKRRQIRSVFMTPLSLLNGEGAARTATEVMTGREERFQQFVPVLNRIQAELFTPVLERALELLVRQGAIDTPPGSVAFRFITPFSQARRNAEARRLLSTLETLRPLTEAVPQLAERLDLEQAFAEVAEGLGTPLRANPPETQETAEVSA